MRTAHIRQRIRTYWEGSFAGNHFWIHVGLNCPLASKAKKWGSFPPPQFSLLLLIGCVLQPWQQQDSSRGNGSISLVEVQTGHLICGETFWRAGSSWSASTCSRGLLHFSLPRLAAAIRGSSMWPLCTRSSSLLWGGGSDCLGRAVLQAQEQGSLPLCLFTKRRWWLSWKQRGTWTMLFESRNTWCPHHHFASAVIASASVRSVAMAQQGSKCRLKLKCHMIRVVWPHNRGWSCDMGQLCNTNSGAILTS